MGSETAHVEGVLCFTGYPSVSRPWGKQSRRPDAPDLPCVGEAYAGAVRGSPPGLGALLKSHATLRMEGKATNPPMTPERVTLHAINPREEKLNTGRGHGEEQSAC
ncbi:uncharacterized [Tachysurus ichikawai]